MKHTRNTALALLILISSLAAQADNIRVLAAGAAKAAVERIAPEFTRQTGHTLSATYDTVGAQRARVSQAAPGAVADLVILSQSALQQLRVEGKLQIEPALDIGAVAVSLAVPQGSPLPELSTPEALRRTLLAAPSIAYADPARGATAGSHFARVMDELGLRAQLQSRITVLPFGVEVIEAVSKGQYALGVSQSSEIVQHEGVALAGPLPTPYALRTRYGTALTSPLPAARELFTYLASPPGLAAMWRAGFLVD